MSGAPRDLATLLEGRDVEKLSYAELSDLAGKWIREMEARGEALEPGGFAAVHRMLNARTFGPFRSWCRPRSHLGRAQVELFLTARLRRYVLPYLSIQEGKDYDQTGGATWRAARLFAYYLNSAGKRPWMRFRLRGAGPWASLSLDPMPLLRPVYAAILRAHRQGRDLTFRESARVRFHAGRFALRTWSLRQVLKLMALLGRRTWTAAELRRIFGWRVVQKYVCLAILTLFPQARNLEDDEWRRLLSRLEAYFPERIERLFQVIPASSLQSHGVAKLLKIALGVVLGRAAQAPREEGTTGDWIFETFTMAWCWGITYPLVDNVLDSDEAGGTRRELVDALRALFSPETSCAAPSPPIRHPAAREAVVRLEELLRILPVDRLGVAQHWFRLLLEAHHRDSSRRLPDGEVTDAEVESVWRDSLLKAALIRLATLAVCGHPVEAAALAQQFRAALLNQWGDDLWDVYEDSADRRMTPFTLFVHQRTARNPFLFFLRYARLTGAGLSHRRQVALLVGAMETSRCLLEEIARRGSDPLGAEPTLREAMDAVGVDPALVRATPHLDADAILFAFEKSLLEG